MLVGLFTMVLITGSLPYCPENKSPKLSQKTSIIHYPLSYCPEVMETRVQSYHKKNIHYQHHLTEAGPMSCFLEFDGTQQNGI